MLVLLMNNIPFRTAYTTITYTLTILFFGRLHLFYVFSFFVVFRLISICFDCPHVFPPFQIQYVAILFLGTVI